MHDVWSSLDLTTLINCNLLPLLCYCLQNTCIVLLILNTVNRNQKLERSGMTDCECEIKNLIALHLYIEK